MEIFPSNAGRVDWKLVWLLEDTNEPQHKDNNYDNNVSELSS